MSESVELVTPNRSVGTEPRSKMIVHDEEHHTIYRTLMGRLASILYGLSLLVFAVMVPWSVFISGQNQSYTWATVFYVYVYGVGTIYVVVTSVMLGNYRPKVIAFVKTAGQILAEDQPQVVSDDESTECLCQSVHSCDRVERALHELNKCQFHDMGDGVNFFLRLGLIGFALVSMMLHGFYIVSFLQDAEGWRCYGPHLIIINIAAILFIFSIAYFIFKYHKTVLLFRTAIMKLGVVHVVMACICLWVYMIMMEGMDLYQTSLRHHDSNATSKIEVEPRAGRAVRAAATPSTTTVVVTEHTLPDCEMRRASIASLASPYLFPFVVQFALIAAAVLYRMYTCIGQKLQQKDIIGFVANGQRNTSLPECYKSTKGLFLGVLVFTINTALAIIYVAYQVKPQPSEQEEHIKSHIFVATEIATNVLLLLGLLIAWKQMAKLGLRRDIDGRFDLNLILITLGGHFFLCAAVAIAAAYHIHSNSSKSYYAILHLVAKVVSFIESSVQVAFIGIALRRFCSTEALFLSKPGRSAVTFLLLCNLSLWLVGTFLQKGIVQDKVMVQFYGHSGWTVLVCIVLPCSILFRFHSAICLADVWTQAYSNRQAAALANISGSLSEDDLKEITSDSHKNPADQSPPNTPAVASSTPRASPSEPRPSTSNAPTLCKRSPSPSTNKPPESPSTSAKLDSASKPQNSPALSQKKPSKSKNSSTESLITSA